MKKILKAVMCICLVAALLNIYTNTVDTVKSGLSFTALAEKEVHLTAHRGLSSVAPENTAAALEQAGKAGYYAAEFDVMPSADGVWVLMHDSTVDRMTNGEGEVSSFTYAQLCELKIDAGNNVEKYPDEKIITLEEAVEICKKYSMRPMIEIKGGEPESVAQVLNIINRTGVSDEALIIDFDSERIEKLRSLDSTVELWYLISKDDGSAVEFAKKNNTAIAFNHKKLVNYGMIKTAKEEGITLAAWTVDCLPMMDILTFAGVNYITTNRILP